MINIYIVWMLPSSISINLLFFSLSTEVETVDLGHYCHDHCNCTTSTYDPVCGSDGIQYFTPCHGGCMSMESDDEGNEVNLIFLLIYPAKVWYSTP